MLQFLNSNAGAIQALASCASVLVTLALFIITYRYVRLTQSLAESARKQMSLQVGEREARRLQFTSLATALRELLKDLPHDQAQAEQIRHARTWSDAMLTGLARLAAEIGPATAADAAVAVGHIRFLQERIESVKKTDQFTGVDWLRFGWDHWLEALYRSREAIDRLLSVDESIDRFR